MTDDYFIDDVLLQTSKSKKLNSKDKGRRGESDLCKVLSKRFSDSFSRVIGSGSRWSQANLSEQAKQVMTGDIVCPEKFRFCIECKYGYANIDLCTVFDDGNRELNSFLEQAEKDATRIGRRPLLCWRKPRQEWIAAFKRGDLLEAFTYKLYYKDWVFASLDEILKLDNCAFYV